jgi:hypothetical protein
MRLTNRQGQEITPQEHERLIGQPSYRVVRIFRNDQHRAMVCWDGMGERPFRFQVERATAPGGPYCAVAGGVEPCRTEKSALRLYEHWIVEHGLGEWFPSTDPDALDGQRLMEYGNLATEGRPVQDTAQRRELVRQVQDNDDFASW